MQETVRIRMDLLVALNAVGVEAHAVCCLCKDLCEIEGIGMCLK
jgi:hypothetical protein